MRRLLPLMMFSTAALTGCPADPLPTPGQPEAGLDMRLSDGGPRDSRADGPRFDAGDTAPDGPEDAAPRDLEPDLPPEPDYGPLPDPEVAPALDRATVLVGRTDTWVGWIIDRRLITVRIDTLVAADPDGGEPADGDLPTMQRPDIVAVVPEFEGRLVGVRAPNGRPWVLVPDGAEGMLRAHDLSRDLRTPRPLRLWPPVRTAIDGESILLVGRAGPEADARVATVHLLDDGPLDPVVDTQGITLPAAVSPGLAGWVFAFADGVCQTYLPTGDPATNPSPGNIWRCGARPDITLVGDNRRLYAVGAVADNVRAWTTMPGAGRAPPSAPIDDEPRDVTLALDATVDPLHPIPGGHAVRVEDADGVRLHLLTPDAIRILDAPADRVVLGASRFFQNRFLVAWDPMLGRPVLENVAAADGPAPPVDGLGCRPLPELCNDLDSGIDLDCVGGLQNGLCCRNPSDINLERTALDVSTSDVERNDVPVEPWFIAQNLVAPMAMVAYGDRLDLLQLRPGGPIDNDAEGVRIARFDDIDRIERFGQRFNNFVIHGHRLPGADGPDAGPDAGPADLGPDPDADAPTDLLLWYLGRRLDEEAGTFTVFTYESPAPCLPILHLTMRDDMARIYCADEAVDVPFDQDGGPRLGDAISVPYPADDVRWIGPYITDTTDQLFLAATGDNHQLHAWRDTLDGDAIEDEALPGSVAAMAPEDRALPIRMPEDETIHPARIAGARVEVYLPGIGWMPGPSTQWPERAMFSANQPIAMTLAEITDPDAPGYTRANRRYVITLHALERDELHWGQRVAIHDPEDPRIVGRFMHGVRFSDYDAGRPVLWYGFGDDANITVRPRGVLCHAAADLDPEDE